jgi:cyclin-dependent kinase-like
MKKFETLGVIGIGAYGIVLKAKNTETGETVAIKKFKESDSDETIRKISLREVKILKMVNHPNIVHLMESFRRKEKLHLVFEYSERTVLEVLEKTPHGVDMEKIRVYLYQVFKGVRYLHNHQILHRDIKPENLLVNSDNTLKLCDFGFARKIPQESVPLTDYVATRWYRSPDL